MDEKHETDGDLHQEEVIEVLNDERRLDNELKHEPLAKDEKQRESKLNENPVLQTDIQWGRKMLEKLLTNLGFL